MTAADLKSAWLASGLWRRGMSFDEALAKPALRRQLEAHARALEILMQRRGETVPKQQEIALCNG